MNEEPKQRTALARHLDKWAMFLWREDTPGFGGWDVAKWYAQQADLHDRLVAMLEDNMWEGDCDFDDDGNAIPTCICCGERHQGFGKGHADDCKLAALLKEARGD